MDATTPAAIRNEKPTRRGARESGPSADPIDEHNLFMGMEL